MSSKRNDLSAYKGGGSKQVLTTPPPRPVAQAPLVGRPKKPKAEKRDRKVLLSLTPGEEAKLKAKAGLVPVATYVTSVLRGQGVFD